MCRPLNYIDIVRLPNGDRQVQEAPCALGVSLYPCCLQGGYGYEDKPRFFSPVPVKHRLQPQAEPRLSAGSGVIVDATRGYVLTNHHVVANARKILVTLKDGRRLDAKLVGPDKGTDIAVLQIPARNLTALPFGDSDALRVGDYVVAIGNPFGLGQTVTSGIVSALGRSGLSREGYEDFIQTDASINSGNSGGALVTFDGRLAGINSAILSPAGGNIGIGFAVPSVSNWRRYQRTALALYKLLSWIKLSRILARSQGLRL